MELNFFCLVYSSIALITTELVLYKSCIDGIIHTQMATCAWSAITGRDRKPYGLRNPSHRLKSSFSRFTTIYRDFIDFGVSCTLPANFLYLVCTLVLTLALVLGVSTFSCLSTSGLRRKRTLYVIASLKGTDPANEHSCLGFDFASDQGSGMKFQNHTKLIDFPSPVH